MRGETLETASVTGEVGSFNASKRCNCCIELARPAEPVAQAYAEQTIRDGLKGCQAFERGLFDSGSRTRDPQISGLLLYQVSYIEVVGLWPHVGIRCFREAVPVRLFEPYPLTCGQHKKLNLPFDEFSEDSKPKSIASFEVTPN